MDLRRTKLKIKKFWRDNERLILLIIAAFMLGIVTAGANYLSYQNSLNKFELDGQRQITNNQDVNFSFTLNNPGLARETALDLHFSGVESGAPLSISVNGRDVQEVNSDTVIVRLSADVLENENTVIISRAETGFKEQDLLEAKVTSTTNFRQLMFVLLNLASLLLMAAPVMYIKYEQYIEKRKMERKFPEFLRDVVEGTRAGMSLPQAIQNTETGSYGPLDDKIEKMNAQLDWGIPFDQVLRTFGQETNSNVILRSVDTIIQAYKSGGNIQDVLESVGDNIRTIRQLKEQRESQLYGEMITGYIVYFIFIGILIALTTYLLPNLANAQQSLGSGFTAFGSSGGATLQQNIALYREWFQRLIFIQALFSGLIIGKLAEGELKAGLKHMALLFAAGYLAVTFFI